MVAVDKIAGDRLSVVAEGRGGDECLRTSLRMSLSCSRGQLASAVHDRGCCGRLLAAVADLTAELWSSRGSSATREGRARRLGEGKGQNGRGVAATGRGGSVCARAKHALWARPERARQAFGEMPRQARWLGWGWVLAGLGWRHLGA